MTKHVFGRPFRYYGRFVPTQCASSDGGEGVKRVGRNGKRIAPGSRWWRITLPLIAYGYLLPSCLNENAVDSGLANSHWA